jgi:hypothetical protein
MYIFVLPREDNVLWWKKEENIESQITELYAKLHPYPILSIRLFCTCSLLWQKSDFFLSINGLSTKWEHQLFMKVPKSNTSIWERAKIKHINLRKGQNYTHQNKTDERKVPKFHNLGIPLNCLNMRNYLFKYPQLFFVQIHVIFFNIYAKMCMIYPYIKKKQ